MGRSSFLRAAALILASTPLAACGGGGKPGPTISSLPSSPPTASRVLYQGAGRDFLIVQDEAGVASSSGFSASAAASLEVTRDEKGAVSRIALSSDGLSTSWSAANRELNKDDGLLVGLKTLTGPDGEQRAVAVIAPAPDASGFEHQSFGLWYDLSPGSRSSRFGAVGAGERTAAAAIPTAGSAVFLGQAAGMRASVEGGEAGFQILRAQTRVEADFAARTARFSTSGSTAGRDAAGPVAAAALDMSGSLRMTRDGLLSGTVETKSGLRGDLEARFYGPQANEVGGTFSLRGEGVESLVGGFGAKKQ